MLTVSQLSKSFAGRVLFDNVSLQVNRGFFPQETRP
jgi:ABC-type transporter Mla maintaining outer membrane lipid asymmetry ATPase subunit MlaF